MKKRVALLGTTVVALALVAAMSFAWFTSSTGPISTDFGTAKIKVELVSEGTQQDSTNKLPGEEIKVEGIQIKNSSTRNAVAKVSFSEASVVANIDGDDLYKEATNGGEWAEWLEYFGSDLSTFAYAAYEPGYGYNLISEEQSKSLQACFEDMRWSSNNPNHLLPMNQEILDFLTICKENNISAYNANDGTPKSFNDSPVCLAYLEAASTVVPQLASNLQVSLLDNFAAVAQANNLLYTQIDGSYYVALTTPTPADEVITFDLGFTIPTDWGNEYQNITVTGVGITVDAVQCTKAAVTDVYGLSATEIAQLETAFSSLPDFWTD